MNPCPECGSTDRERADGEYALIKLVRGGIQFNLDAATNEAFIVNVTVCKNCGGVALADAG